MTAPPLRGIGWDHPRCSGPLDEAAKQWQAEDHGTVEWVYRPLADFNSAPLDGLAREYDLLVVDHPMLPADAALFRPLGALNAVRDARRLSVGCCGTAYDWDGATLAVPIDVAAHVSASRPDMLAELGEPCPGDWDAVLDLAKRHPGQVVASLTGDDALCMLLTITASMQQPITAIREPCIDAVDLLVRLAEHCSPVCTELRPPAVLGMLADGRAAYTPALFGYATYLRAPGSLLVYGPVPKHPAGTASGVMGGAGLAVSALSGAATKAEQFVEWIISPVVQRHVLVAAGGQPAAVAVWDDPTADVDLGGFLTQTRLAMEQASVRLRHPGWPAFHRRAAGLLQDALPERWPSEALYVALRNAHAQTIRVVGLDGKT